ncbi:FixH family protein [Neolewinella antarctica]|uniref:Nitrogen fixation protein FixH n=1 Tax=Neolewinella antarctica TaxID=442734 RepID=A0ABX0X9E2_9BACT|nr:FixH family protein [Neolewinella antarctica]NJC25579.1 hypothetical protein [Neolewinella antarctica]
MKFHWGHGILVFYIVFVACLVVVVIGSRGFDNSLVTEAYYERDINYQQEYDRRRNSYLLAERPYVAPTEKGLYLIFPAALATNVKGTILLYRPSSRRDDRRITINTVGGEMRLNTKGLKSGRYQAIVEWAQGGVDYYDELDLTVQ